ncbi:MAG TPA: hypothetical protein VHA52_00490 [Candidatus Babeliaceae bacterium]|nr:hypothetical protein [Candidatus Babeliaceae bacterium]
MRKYFLILLLTPLLGIGQTKTVLTSNRIFAKNDKVEEFEKALANHAQKYHTGDLKWRVWSIESGPDANGYMITEGPSSWDMLDGRGDISAEHTEDWEKNVLPLTSGQGQSAYADFEADLSTVQLTDYADKIVITHITAKPGKINDVKNLISKFKKVWEDSKESVAVYSTAFSGEPGFVYVTRLKNGLKELAPDYRKPSAERYDAVYGAGSFDAWLKDYADAVQSRWSEILIYKPELSSK